MFPKTEQKCQKFVFQDLQEDWEQRKFRGIGKTYTGLTEGKSKRKISDMVMLSLSLIWTFSKIKKLHLNN